MDASYGLLAGPNLDWRERFMPGNERSGRKGAGAAMLLEDPTNETDRMYEEVAAQKAA
jgi:hypothetical protein